MFSSLWLLMDNENDVWSIWVPNKDVTSAILISLWTFIVGWSWGEGIPISPKMMNASCSENCFQNYFVFLPPKEGHVIGVQLFDSGQDFLDRSSKSCCATWLSHSDSTSSSKLRLNLSLPQRHQGHNRNPRSRTTQPAPWKFLQKTSL